MDISINIDIDGYTRTDISDDMLLSITDSTIVLMLDETTNDKLYTYYSTVRSLITNNNKVIILLSGTESKIRKQICMLAASYRRYDIYSVDDVNIVDREYIDTIMERTPDIDEVEQFIGADIATYSEINSVMLQLTDHLDDNTLDEFISIVEHNRDIIENSVEIYNYMKRIVDNANEGTTRKLSELKDKSDTLEKQVNQYRLKYESAVEQYESVENEMKALKNEASSYRKKCYDLENAINKSGPIIASYSEVMTSKVKCEPTSIIYFKEIEPCIYINSFVSALHNLLNNFGVNTKLVIYDNRHVFLNKYKPLSIVDAMAYMNNQKAVVETQDRIVVVETNQAIIEDILACRKYKVVIIYDRLKQKNDIVTGNNVYKYWVVNSAELLKSMQKQFGIEFNRVITMEGVCKEAIALRTIPDYKGCSESAQLRGYAALRQSGASREKVIDSILKTAHIKIER